MEFHVDRTGMETCRTTCRKNPRAAVAAAVGRNVEIQYRGVPDVPGRLEARHTVCSLQRRGEQTEIPINHPVTSREPRRSLLPRISQ